MRRQFPLTIAAAAIAALAGGPLAAAEPLVAQGIGMTACSKVTPDIRPAEGLKNPVNLMLYSWAQGYLSAANVSLLEEDGKHVDMSGLDEPKLLQLVLEFCKANPDRKPAAALDEFIRKTDKLKAKWDPGTVDWNG